MGQSSDEKRSSLLDVVRDNLNRQGKSMMYRVVVTGELRNVAERAEYGAHNQKFFKQYQGDADLITGMLMVLQDTFIHALEASQKVSLAFLRELGVRLPPPLAAISDQVKARADLEAYMRGPLPVEHRYVKNVRVLLVLEDAGQRFFPFWASRVVEANPNASAVYVDEAGFAESAVAKTIADLCVAFCNIGSGLSNLTKNDLKNALDELPERFKDLMPSAEILRFIAGCKRIMSIDEWLDIFDGHVRVPKESDLVWPMYKAIVI
ncbi:hypothetical protein HK101_010041 [Irineochytrium annulatum]|nr:hypothetical protein HK101_010041 [Irineochytrium annulatum]